MKNRPIPERETILVEILDLADTPQQKNINENTVEYMNNLILQAELIEALPIQDVKEKKPKM